MLWEHRICWVPGRHIYLSGLEASLALLRLCLCLFLVLDKVGSGSHYMRQKLTSACLGLGEQYFLLDGASVAGLGAACVSGRGV